MLPFSRKIFYAFEAITYIALHHSSNPISGKKLADIQNVSPRYLEQIMQKMVKAGMLRSIRGPRGGYILAKERRKITLKNVFELLQYEDDANTIDNITKLSEKVILPFCRDINKQLMKELDKTTLSDLYDTAYKNQALESEQKKSRITNHDFVI